MPSCLQAVLSSIVRDTISEATSRLTNDYLTVLKSDLIRQCEGMLDTNIVIMEKQVAAKDKATVAEAARKAVRCYKDEVTSAVDLQHTTDHTSASNTCKVSTDEYQQSQQLGCKWFNIIHWHFMHSSSCTA